MKTPHSQQNNWIVTATLFYLQWDLHLCLFPNTNQSEETYMVLYVVLYDDT